MGYGNFQEFPHFEWIFIVYLVWVPSIFRGYVSSFGGVYVGLVSFFIDIMGLVI